MHDKVLNEQNPHWEKTYTANTEHFGAEPSESARKAVQLFKAEGVNEILELGAGQGRDTLFFGSEGFHVHALDYSETGTEANRRKAQTLGLSHCIAVTAHDVRAPLPLPDASFDACYAHMLFCMAMTTAEIESLAGEVLRVLCPGGICIYTVRHTNDPHYGAGIHRGEDMYEVDGFIVHFFSRAKVEQLAAQYADVKISEFEEGTLPRKLFLSLREKNKSLFLLDFALCGG
jgi:SAM-dependent methyltransferase